MYQKYQVCYIGLLVIVVRVKSWGCKFIRQYDKFMRFDRNSSCSCAFKGKISYFCDLSFFNLSLQDDSWSKIAWIRFISVRLRALYNLTSLSLYKEIPRASLHCGSAQLSASLMPLTLGRIVTESKRHQVGTVGIRYLIFSSAFWLAPLRFRSTCKRKQLFSLT